MNAPRLIPFPACTDPRGSLVALECNQGLPFDLKRVFYIYNVPERATRGGHAHKSCHQVLVAVGGSLLVLVDNGMYLFDYVLDSPEKGLYIPPGNRVEMSGFSPGAVLLVLASEYYDENDYLR